MSTTTDRDTLPKTDPASSHLVSVSGLNKQFNGREILNDVSFHLDSGEITTIIGASGSGKSTILRVLAGLADPDDGEITFEGETVFENHARTKAWNERAAHVGMVFQSYTLWPHMNVLDNLTLAPRKTLKLPPDEARFLAEKALAEVGMKQHILSRSTQLSGGERQRVAIARALMMKPRLLLCDEITSALDPPVAAEVLEVLRRLKATEGIAVVLVTHDMSFASRAADRVLFVSGGTIAVNETPEVAFTRSDNEELSRFVAALRF